MTEAFQEPDRSPDGSETAETRDRMTPCADIQDVLFDYMTRELGGARSELVRQHLRKCADCQRAAAEMQDTLDLMRQASREEAEAIPAHLSAERRKRMLRAVTHPVLDWAYRHHILISALIAVAAVAAVALYLRTVHMRRTDIPDTRYPVIIRRLAPGPQTQRAPASP